MKKLVCASKYLLFSCIFIVVFNLFLEIILVLCIISSIILFIFLVFFWFYEKINNKIVGRGQNPEKHKTEG